MDLLIKYDWNSITQVRISLFYICYTSQTMTLQTAILPIRYAIFQVLRSTSLADSYYYVNYKYVG